MKDFHKYLIGFLVPFFLIFICCVSICFFCFGLTVISSSAVSGDFVGEENIYTDFSGDDDQNRIAVIQINGVIGITSPIDDSYSFENIVPQIDSAIQDETVKAILFVINSPGGEVLASDDLYKEVKAASEIKPIYVYSENVLASGAYWVAIAANEIIVHPFNTSGSIGVFSETISFDGLLENLGIEIERVPSTNSELKLSEDASRQSQIEVLDLIYDRFVELIAEERGISESDLRNNIAKGQVFSSNRAKELNLIDEIGDFEFTIDRIKEAEEIPNAEVFEYSIEEDFWSSFGAVERVFNILRGSATDSGSIVAL